MATLNILIVEYEKKIADTLKQGLSENGFYTQVCYDGHLGLKLFRHGAFDLVILDISLPGLSGHELCNAIRQINPKVPLILLTATGPAGEKLEGIDTGADDYIAKPFDFRELLVRIKALLKRLYSPVEKNERLQADDLVMNLDSKEVSRDGKPIPLTAKEFQLLEYLLRNKNRVLSRSDIALNVWDINFDSGTNVIEVYVNYLRRKIDKDREHPLIHTQAGMGYVLKDNS